MSDKFLQNLYHIHTNKPIIHDSHVKEKIIGFAHEYCNSQVRENYFTIPIIVHNQFRFDFFLFLKGLRPKIWESTDINIGGRNTTDINFAIIKNQVRFIDTVKYFQQSLANLASGLTKIETKNVRKNFKRILAHKLKFCNNEQEKLVLDYLTSGKGIIPSQMITNLDSLKTKPKDGDFLEKQDFYSSLKQKHIADNEYHNVKKLFKLLRLETLGDMNKIYNIQDTLILCEIFEQRSALLQNLFKFNPRKCNSASSFLGYVQKNKSKCNIVLPTDAKKIRIFEITLIGGYSCVNTRMAFDTEPFLKDKENEKVVFETVDGEVKRFLSKIIKMDENNQYGFAMTKPLPYECVKLKKAVPTLDELKDFLANVTLEDKIGHLFVVDIIFADINEKPLLFNEFYPHIFEKNMKIEPFEGSCAQIMRRAEVKKKI